jgi:hypothetical protein
VLDLAGPARLRNQAPALLINAPVLQPALFVTEIYIYCISYSMLHVLRRGTYL